MQFALLVLVLGVASEPVGIQSGAGSVVFRVYPAPGFPIETLSRYGTVIAEFGPSENRELLLRTDEESILELNRLPVQLVRVPNTDCTPMAPSFPAPALVPVSDSLIQEIVDKVSAESVLATIRRLQAFRTRYVTTESCRAAVNYALGRLAAYRCDTVFTHSYQTGYAPNVIAEKRGWDNPRLIYCLCGHIDNTSEQAPNFCPGADDNASGTAVVLEACRVLADYNFAQTFRFLVFTGEEQGLVGSQAYVSQCAARGDSIVLAMNFDMVSYGLTGGDSVHVWGKTANPPCSLYAEMYCASADTYTSLRYHKYFGASLPSSSDHASFWQYGYKCIRDKESDVTPMYHTTGDTVGPLHFTGCGTNDIPMTVEAIKATVALFARLAGVRRLTPVEEQERRRSTWELGACVPNPFKSSTRIRYNAGTDVSAVVSVYDMRGGLTRRFPVRGAGELDWDGANQRGRSASPGVYFYRLEGKRLSDFGKVVVSSR
jgi:hypothetical protein